MTHAANFRFQVREETETAVHQVSTRGRAQNRVTNIQVSYFIAESNQRNKEEQETVLRYINQIMANDILTYMLLLSKKCDWAELIFTK